MKLRLALLFGGKSVEHEVSVISALQAMQNLDTEKYDITPVYLTKKNVMYTGGRVGEIDAYKDINSLLAGAEESYMINEDGEVVIKSVKTKMFGKEKRTVIDCVLPVVHGTNVEDGALQGYLKTLGVPFAGCDVTASALGMDKYYMKPVLKEAGVPLLDAGIYRLSDYAEPEKLLETIEKRFGYPVIIKPVNLGSSVGISLAKDRGALMESIDNAFLYSSRVLAEHGIEKLREINCAVLGDENDARASECEEPLHSKDILSYEDKYVHGGKESKSSGMAGVSRKIPAEISPELRERIRELAVTAFRALGCAGVARMDFMIDEESGELYFNEINTIPGSLSFYLWEPLGLSYKELLDELVNLAMKRARAEEEINYSFDTTILKSASFGSKGGSKR